MITSDISILINPVLSGENHMLSGVAAKLQSLILVNLLSLA